jgi:hypothetical protein
MLISEQQKILNINAERKERGNMKRILAIAMLVLSLAGLSSAVTYKLKLAGFYTSASTSAPLVTWTFHREFTSKLGAMSESDGFTGTYGYVDQFDDAQTSHQGYRVIFPGGYYQDVNENWHYCNPDEFMLKKGESPSEHHNSPYTAIWLPGEPYTLCTEVVLGDER